MAACAFAAAALRRGIPFSILTVENAEIRALYDCDLALIRPDQHVAWRGRACDDTDMAEAVFARCLGGNRAN